MHHAFYSEFKGCIIDIATYSFNLMVLRFRGLLLTVPFQAEVSARTMETQFLFVQIGSISGDWQWEPQQENTHYSEPELQMGSICELEGQLSMQLGYP